MCTNTAFRYVFSVDDVQCNFARGYHSQLLSWVSKILSSCYVRWRAMGYR